MKNGIVYFMKTYKVVAVVLATMPFTFACTTTNYGLKDEQMTVAKAQREIKIGMPSSAVVEALGSPNMVTTDSERQETWVYDKVSTNVQSSSSHNGVWLLLWSAGGKEQQTSSNQRTLTIIVKFDKNGLVRDFAYRTSSF
jgi:outer membrane protein assembly factor BamE (lipoprotein component of BamABCDE complex)